MSLGTAPPFPTPPPPRLARLCAPAGPAQAVWLRTAEAEVLILSGRYCVSYLLLGPETAAVLDVGSAADVPGIARALEGLGRPATSLRWVIPSHLHFDHAMGLDACARRFGAAVLLGDVAHAHVTQGRPLRFPGRRRLWRAVLTWPLQGLPFPPPADWRHGLDFGTPWGRDRFSAPLAPPLADGEPVPGLPGWTLLAAPGHADDGICLYHAAAGWLLAGDTVRNFYGGEWNPLLADPAGMLRTKARLLALPPLALVGPGHGPLVTGPDALARLQQVRLQP